MQLHKDFSQPFFQYLQWPFLDSIINVPEFLHRLLQEAENGMLSTFGEVAQCKREFFRKLDSPWLLNVYSPSFLPLFTLFLGPLLVLGLSHQLIFLLLGHFIITNSSILFSSWLSCFDIFFTVIPREKIRVMTEHTRVFKE